MMRRLLPTTPPLVAVTAKLLLEVNGWAVVWIVLIAGAATWALLIRQQYAQHPGWKELPTLDRLLSILSDMVGLAQLSAAMTSVEVHRRVPIRWTQISILIGDTLGARLREARTNPNRTFYDALRWYARHFSRRTQGLSEEWARRLFPPLVPTFFAASGLAASAAFASSIQMGHPIAVLILLAAAALTTTGAALAHACRNPLACQLSMMSAGAVILYLSSYLWYVDIGFKSHTPDALGRVPGVAFGLSLILWVLAARTDPDGERWYCSAAAFATAGLGAILIGVNAWDRIHAGSMSFHDAANLAWPMGIVVAGFISAISRKEWLAGVRHAAVTGEVSETTIKFRDEESA